MSSQILNEVPWVAIARRYIGQKEIPGIKTAPFITKALIYVKAWWTDDETPWCGVGAGACMKAAGYSIPKECYRAKEWLKWGISIPKPIYGCVVVFTRDGGGHVGFVVGIDSRGRLMVLGGNQKNAVRIDPFDTSRVSGYRMPADYPVLQYEKTMPILNSAEVSSTNEA